MLTLTSPAFSHDGPIPRAHTCDGADQSPPLAWSGVPAAAQQLALIVDDPDAPGRTFVHWVLYAMPPKTTGLPAGVPRDVGRPSGPAFPVDANIRMAEGDEPAPHRGDVIDTV